MRQQLLEHPYKPFTEKENDLNILLIKEPELPEKAFENLEIHKPCEEMTIDGSETGPSTVYHFHQIGFWDYIKEAFYEVFERNMNLLGVRVIKIGVSFSILIEFHGHKGFHGASHRGNSDDNVKYNLFLGDENKGHVIPHIYRLSDWKIEQENYLYYLHIEIQKMIEFTGST
jgi:hypothetical protein